MPTSTGWPHAWSMRRLQVAGMLRSIPAEFASVGWPSRVLEQLGALHLLIQAHRRLEELPADLASTVRARIGYPIGKAEVLALPGTVDHWFAVGMVDTAEYRLDTRRVWLYGAASGRWAVIMSFAPPGGPLDDTVVAGNLLHARLHFYPGSGQFRALVGEQTSAAGDDDATGRVIHRRTRSLWAGSSQPIRGLPAAGSDQCSSRAEPWPVSAGRQWRMLHDHRSCRGALALARSFRRRADRGLRRVVSPRVPPVELARDG